MILADSTPDRGQGLNNAMKDAADLVDAVRSVVAGNKSLAEAVTAYEEEMRPRGAKEVRLSYQQAVESRQWDTLKSSPMMRYGHERT